jgi:methionine salvage enolase-phosphatase E1
MYRIWFDCDEEGNIIRSYSGHVDYIVETQEEYQHVIEVEEDITLKLHEYRFINNELVLK